MTEARPVDFSTFYRASSAEVFRTLCVVLRDAALTQYARNLAVRPTQR